MSVPFGRSDRRRLQRFNEGQQYLNPWLYRRLLRLFGSVLLAHEGEQLIARSSVDLLRGRPKLLFQQHGEAYRVCCPFCPDTRHRLYVSYMYGQRDDDGRSLSFLVFCFNEDCMDDPDNRWRLRSMLEDRDGALECARVFRGAVREAANDTFELPGECSLLSELPTGHEARVYVANRHYDPDRLARVWGVSFCHHSVYRLASQRLIVPIRFEGRLAGWQARHVGELDWKAKKLPKYFTCPGMRRDLVICNWDMARAYRTLVIVEGWFDVFGFGPMAVNTLGAGMSPQQLKRIVRHGRRPGHSVVLLYDEDVQRKPQLKARIDEQARGLARALPGRFVRVELPQGVDPGSLDRRLNRALVEQQAELAGVPVWWTRSDDNQGGST